MSNDVDRERAMRMVPLLERGEEALRLRCAARPKGEQLVVGAIPVVTQEDFAANALLCLEYALHTGPIHILCDDDVALFALLARLKRR